MSVQGQDAAVTPLQNWRKLQPLWSMQGSIALLEAAVSAWLTDEHTSHNTSSMMMHMLIQADHPTLACTEAQVSLAETFMKLVKIHKLVGSPLSPSNRGQQFDLPCVTSAMDILGGVLISVLACIHRLESNSKPDCSNTPSREHSNSFVSNHSNKQRLNQALASGGNSSGGNSGSGGSNGDGSYSNSPSGMLESTNLFQQIHSLL